MSKVIIWVMSILFGLSLVLVLFTTGTQLVVFDRDRYQQAYEQFDRTTATGMSMDDLMMVTDGLLDYLKGDRDNLMMSAPVYGQQQVVFGEDERAHMVDVEKLFHIGFTARTEAGILAVIAVAVVLLLTRRVKSLITALAKGYLAGFGICLVILLALGTYVLIDFDQAFLNFHLLLFHNGLWMMDPATQVMIRMFPEQFFYQMAVAILLSGTAFILLPLVAAILWLICRKKRARKA